MDPRLRSAAALAPYAVLAAVLRQVPGPDPARPTPWPLAAAVAAALLAYVAAHAWAYRRWAAHAPNRMLVNEFLIRAWLVLAGLAAVGARGEYGGLYLVMAAPWAVASWCTHYLVLRRQGAYRARSNLALLGLFLVGLALMGLLCVRLGLADAA